MSDHGAEVLFYTEMSCYIGVDVFTHVKNAQTSFLAF